MKRSLILALLVLASAIATADERDWPQWRGPDRTGLSTETGLLKEWPPEGPKLIWKSKGLGDGFSTPSVAGGRIYVLGTKGGQPAQGKGKGGGGKDEYLFALSTADGKPAWEVKFGSTAGGYPGPRCTPTVDGDRIYAISSNGNLICVDTGKGNLIWKKDFKADFGGKSGGWAYTESPLIDGNVLVCTPGGDSAPIVALNKTTGDVIWKAAMPDLPAGGKRGYTTAGYSSVVAATIHGTKQYVQFLSGGVVGIDAKTGKLLWHYEKPANGTANCSTPIVKNDAVFAASGYGTGGGRADITKAGSNFTASEKFFVKQIQNHHGGMVLVGNHIYGTGSGSLLCIDFDSGKIAWEDKSAGKGSVTFADGHIYVRGEKGEIALVEANPKEYVEKGRFKQPDRSSAAAWAHPVVSGGKLFIRDMDVMLCFDVSAK